jgi:hypothetical protein
MEWLVFVIVGCINSLILGGCLFLVSSLCFAPSFCVTGGSKYFLLTL